MTPHARPEEDPFSEKIDWSLWHRLFHLALPHRRFIYPLAVAAVCIAVLEASFAQVTRIAIDAVQRDGANFVVWPYLGTYFGMALAFSISVAVFISSAGNLSNFMSHGIREKTFRRIQELEFAYFDHRPTGWLISRLTSDCDKLARIIAWGCLDLIWAGSLIVAICGFLLWMNWSLGLLVLGVIPLLVIVSRVFQKRLLLSSRETRRYNSLITAAFSEGLQGLTTTKMFVREARNLQDFSRLSKGMYDASVRNATQSALFLPIVLGIGSLATGLLLWIGGQSVIGGMITLGTLVAFIYYTEQFFDPINQIARTIVELQGAQAAGERVLSLLATQPQIVDSPTVLERLARHENQPPVRGQAPDGLPDSIRTIEFRNVAFAYNPDQPIIRNFNLQVRPGETIALVGPSGGGKSTLISLLARFYEPTSGQILVDGQDYRNRSIEWYQSNLGIVLQSSQLFSGTIADNIRYGRLDASQQEIENAARKVRAHEFICELENGYATAVGEHGNRLSTGQKQLVAFARAIIANPRIFVMDEATSSIDTGTEAAIQKGLETLFEGRISFVIAHRLSTIRNADRILVIENGEIRESGSHAELLALKGAYYGLYTRQFMTTPGITPASL